MLSRPWDTPGRNQDAPASSVTRFCTADTVAYQCPESNPRIGS